MIRLTVDDSALVMNLNGSQPALVMNLNGSQLESLKTATFPLLQ
jgi:hypothetical protein